jgi:hypothetical protein
MGEVQGIFLVPYQGECEKVNMLIIALVKDPENLMIANKIILYQLLVAYIPDCTCIHVPWNLITVGVKIDSSILVWYC